MTASVTSQAVGTTTTAPTKSRQRPCDSCRKRRTKCVKNESDPKCFLCNFHNSECTFNDPPIKKRKTIRESPSSSSYQNNSTDKNPSDSNQLINAQPLSQSLSAASIHGIYPSMESAVQATSNQQPPPQPSSSAISRNPSSTQNDSQQKTYNTETDDITQIRNLISPYTESNQSFSPTFRVSRNSSTSQVLDHMGGGSAGDLSNADTKPSMHSSIIGLTGEWDPSIIENVSETFPLITMETENSVHRQLRKVGHSDGFIDIFPRTHSEQDLNSKELAIVENIVDVTGPSLVSLYFRIVHPSFPILDKETFISHYNTRRGDISSSLLACLYLFALNWWSFDSDLSMTTKPSQKKLEIIAERSLSKEIHKPSLSTVQAGLLLIQHQSFRDQYSQPSQSWVMQSQIVAISQDLGLDQDCQHWNIPQNEKALRKRLAWGLYIQEKWLSMTIGRSSHIQEINWGVGTLTNEDFNERPEENSFSEIKDGTIDFETGKELFIQMAELTIILSSILDQLYSQKAKTYIDSLSTLGETDRLKKQMDIIRPLQIRLREWESNLPKCLVMEDMKRGHISGTPNLYISKFATKFCLLKPVLSHIAKVKADNVLVDHEFMVIRRIVHEKAYFDFHSAVDFLSGMQAEHLQTFWYASARIGFALIVTFGILLTLSTATDTEFRSCLDKVDECGWRLRINSKTAEFLSHSRIWLDQLKKMFAVNLGSSSFRPFNYLPQQQQREEDDNEAQGENVESSDPDIETIYNNSDILSSLFNIQTPFQTPGAHGSVGYEVNIEKPLW